MSMSDNFLVPAWAYSGGVATGTEILKEWKKKKNKVKEKK